MDHPSNNSQFQNRYQSHSTNPNQNYVRRGINDSANRRSSQADQMRDRYNQDEEDEYERRREEELKKQIRAKEAEIQHLSKASDYLRSKLDHSVTNTQRLSQQQQHVDNRYASFGRQVPERDKSPASFNYDQQLSQSMPPNYTNLRHSSQDKSPSNKNSNYANQSLPPLNNISSQAQMQPPPHVKEHMANLQSDNASLMRRLNLVLQELERVSKEKEDLQLRLQHFTKESLNLQRMINGEDNVDKVNKYMQEDLGFEREKNQKLKNQIKEYELYKNDLLKELRRIEDQQDSVGLQSQNMQGDLQKRLNQIQEIEKEIYFTQDKIKANTAAIEQTKRDEMITNAEKQDLQRAVNQLLHERNDLFQKLDNLTMRYDDCVREITRDRQEMERHNKHHSKLVTAKVLFQLLESAMKSQQQKGFQEIKIYCDFDRKCHNKLKQFAKALEVIGRFKQKTTLKKWFHQALKPMEIKQQSKQLAQQIAFTNLKQKYYYKWRNKYQNRINQYDLKTKAVEQIWQMKLNDAQIELKRSFTIWKETLEQFRIKKARLAKLIWSKYFNKLNMAMNTWINHSNNLDTQVRLTLFAQKMTQKQYLNLLYNNFKQQSFERKRKRLNVLFHYLKYWKDFINYRKFLMGAQVNVLHFQQQLDYNIVKACFDALRQNKEEERFNKVHHELNDVEIPTIKSLQEQIMQAQGEKNDQSSKKAGEVLVNLANKTMYQYFAKWKKINQDFKEAPMTKMRGRIIHAYYDKIRMAFNRWKVLKQRAEQITNQFMIEEQQEINNELTQNVITLQKEIKDKSNQKDQSQHKSINKCLVALNKRLLKQAVDRWRDKMNEMNTKESGSELIIKRLRTRLLRQAFNLYLESVKDIRKSLKDEERCAQYNRLRDERLKNQVFKAWVIYKHNFQKSKDYWYRVFLRMDRTLMERGFKRWNAGTKHVNEEQFQEVEKQCIDNISDLNNEIGQITQVDETQKQELKQKKQQLTKQAQRVLANTFANYYYVGETRGFEKWKEFTIYERRRETLMKRMIEHWRKYQFYFVKSTLKNWMKNADINEKKDQLKKEEGRLKDTEFQLDQQRKALQQSENTLNKELQEIKKLQQMYNTRLQKSIQMIVHKVDKNDYMSQKRYIFQQWHKYVKREINFIKHIQNVMQKSLWTIGYKAIKEAARDDFKQERLAKGLDMFRMKFWKRCCGNAFSVWKSGSYTIIQNNLTEIQEETDQILQQQQDKVGNRKQVNATKALKLMLNQRLNHLFRGWSNVTTHQKLVKLKNQQFNDDMIEFKKKFAIRKWYGRQQATQLARSRVQSLKTQFSLMKKRYYFDILKMKYLNVKEFVARLSNFANVHDHQGLRCAYNAIMSYSKAKQYVHYKQKEFSCSQIEQSLQKILLRRKQRYLKELQMRALNRYSQILHRNLTIMHSISNKMRYFFQKWKDSSQQFFLIQEMHDEGPVREQIFEEKIKLKNCQNFMKDEGYSQEEIENVLKDGYDRKRALMLKTIRRMQHNNDDEYVKPKAFDRWKEFVFLRKLFKKWLGYAWKRSTYGRSDMAVAFDRWRKYDTVQKESLQKIPKQQLDNRVVENAQKLGDLADLLQDKEAELRHLSDQRDELVENYIKGQKLALALWVNNHRQGMHKAFLRWRTAVGSIKNGIAEGQLRKNVELIAALKEKIRQLEKDNTDMSGENEELRQFSLDGYEIAKNVQALSQEREKLSVDLADKAQTIRKLLDENERLNNKLQQAQEEAQHLIQSTNSKMGGQQFQSPMVRGSYNAY